MIICDALAPSSEVPDMPGSGQSLFHESRACSKSPVLGIASASNKVVTGLAPTIPDDNKYSFSPSMPSSSGDARTKALIESFVPDLVESSPIQEVRGIETRQTKIEPKPKYCNRAPPAILEARENNFPISAGKTVWILHPRHVDIPVGAGKTGLSWKCKSSKLGQQCTEGIAICLCSQGV